MGRRTIAIIIAVILALAAAGLVYWYVSSVRGEKTVQEVLSTVLIATADIPARTTGEAIVSKRLVAEQQVTTRLVAPGALTDQAQLQEKVLSANVAKGQQIVASQLETPETQSLAFRVKKGMRAVAVPVDRPKGVGGNIAVGDRVDVIVTFKYDVLDQSKVNLGAVLTPQERERIQGLTGIDLGATTSSVTRRLLEQVEVLQIDAVESTDQGSVLGNNDEGQTAPDTPVIVLQVTPDDAEKLVFSQEQGDVWFALIPAEDTQEVPTPGRAIPNVFN